MHMVCCASVAGATTAGRGERGVGATTAQPVTCEPRDNVPALSRNASTFVVIWMLPVVVSLGTCTHFVSVAVAPGARNVAFAGSSNVGYSIVTSVLPGIVWNESHVPVSAAVLAEKL